MSPKKLRFPQTVSHRGIVIAFACEAEDGGPESQPGDLYYNVLDLSLDSPFDDQDWSGFRRLSERRWLRPASMSLLTVTDAEAPTDPGRFKIPSFAPAPFVVLSDDLYVCIFRQTADGGLTLSRYLLIDVTEGTTEEAATRVRELRPAWEPRFQQTQRADVGASRKDGYDFLSLDGDPFIEPIIGVSGVRDLQDGEFTVQLLPTQEPGVQRWQILAVNRPNGPVIEGFSIRRGADGLFDYSDQELEAVEPPTNPPTYRIKPSERFTLRYEPVPGTEGVAVVPVTGIASATYAKQEEAVNTLGESVAVKRGLHLLAALAVKPETGEVPPAGSVATLDFSVGADGRLAPIAEETILAPVDPQTYAASFDGRSVMAIEDQEDAKPLVLGTAFTLQAWLCPTRSSFERVPWIGGGGTDPAALAPTLWLEQDNRIGFGGGFTPNGGGAAEYLETVSPPLPAVRVGAWVQVSVLFDGARLGIYVNGENRHEDAETFKDRTPAATALSTLGQAAVKADAGTATASFVGLLDEVRVWDKVLDAASLRDTLFRQLRGAEVTGPAAYWNFDAPDSDGPALVPDASGHDHVGRLIGARWVPSTAPTSILSNGRTQMSVQGLSVVGGVLTFARTAATPCLFNSADGLVHLYFGEATGAGIPEPRPFAVAQYDTATTRAVFTSPWTENLGGTGTVAFLARATGAPMNDAGIAVQAGSSDDLCNVVLRVREPEAGMAKGVPFQDVFETWRNVPRELGAFVDVLSGRASGDWNSPDVRSGRTLFYDYGGLPSGAPCDDVQRTACRLATGSGHLRFVTARLDLGLKSVAIEADGPDQCTVTFLYRTSRGLELPQIWPAVPAALDRFLAVLNGVSTAYAYQPGASSLNAWALPTTGGHNVLILSKELSALAVSIRPAISGNAATCFVKIQAGDVTATWDEVPRLQIVEPGGAFKYSFVSVLAGGDPHYDYLKHAAGPYADISAKIHVTADGFAESLVVSLDHEVKTTTDLRVGSQLVALVNERAGGRVAPTAGPVEADFVQGACSNDPDAVLSRGSALFGVAAGTVPLEGAHARVEDVTRAERQQVGVSAGWIFESPRNTLDFLGAAWGTVDLRGAPASRLHLPSALTVESWLKPTEQSSAFPRIVHCNSGDVTGEPASRYVLGLRRRAGLRRVLSPQKETGIYCGNDPSVSLAVETFTVEGWLHPTAAKQSVELVRFFGGESVSDYEMGLALGKPYLRLGKKLYAGKTVVPAGAWKHLAAVRTASTVALYVNGVPEEVTETAAPSAKVAEAAEPLGLYLCRFSADPYLANELRVWHAARNAKQVRATFDTYAQGEEAGLTGYWRLNEGVGTTAKNLARATAGRNDGTFVGNSLAWVEAGYFANPFACANGLSRMAPEVGIGANTWRHLAMAYRTGHAVSITEDQDYLDAGNDASLTFNSTMSAEAWVVRQGTGGGTVDAVVSKWGDAAATRSYQLGTMPDGRAFFQVGLDDEDGTVLSATAGAALTAGAHYLAGTMSAATHSVEEPPDSKTFKTYTTVTVKLYVDGRCVQTTLSGSLEGLVGLTRTDGKVYIGAARPQIPASAGAPVEIDNFKGSISDVRLWNACLDAAAILTAFNERAVPNMDGLVSFWRFAEQTGRTAKDDSGTNDATLSNNRLWALFPASAELVFFYDGLRLTGLADAPAEWGGYGQPQISVAGMLDQGTPGNRFDGMLDSIRVWSAFRTPEQILDDLYRPVAGNEVHLAAAWEFNAGSGSHVDDATGHGNVIALNGATTWRESDAPVSDEAPLVTNVLGGVKTAFAVSIVDTPAVAEYGDTQEDAEGQLVSVLKRTYLYGDGEAVRTFSGFKIGDLDTVYIGQVQTAPTLIGYIEGAPPVPSENLSQSEDYPNPSAYAGASSIKLVEADERSYAYNLDYESGFDLSMEAMAAAALNDDTDAGLIIAKKISEAQMKMGGKVTLESSEGVRENAGLTATAGETVSDAVAVIGEWEEAGAGRFVNETIGRRYLPANQGYALVRSSTADRYATRLRSTGAFVSNVTVPNPAIPPDTNIIAFPINPKYVKNGTLDGKVGFENDPDYPGADAERGSYFKPVEAYALKRQIEIEHARTAADYAQYDAGGEGRGHLKFGLSLDDFPGDRLYDRTNEVALRSMVNSYVWSASGGFHAEEQQYTSVREEASGGYRTFSGKAGFHFEGEVTVIAGLYAELDLLFGGHYERSIMKTETSSHGFSMEAEVTGERFLKRWDGQRFSATATPGKVDGYRFLSFYLAPAQRNFDDFFKASAGVLDPYWFANSSDPSAAALREAKGSTNKVWRILHRVTFVSRVPPPFQPAPAETVARPLAPPVRLGANWEVVALVDRVLTERGQTSPTPAEIGDAVATVLENMVGAELAWWPAFLAAKNVAGSTARKQYGTVLSDCVDYLIAYYETKRQAGA